MPYKKDWSETVWEALRRVEAEDTRKNIKMRRVDTSSVTDDRLGENIERHLSNAHVIIADVSEANPNVHIEIGFALARKIPLLLLTQDRRWVTTHLQGWVVDEYANQKEPLARLTTNMLSRIRDKLDLIEAREAQERTRMQSEITYRVECYSHRDAVGLQNYFRGACTRIDILTTNLSFLFEDYDKNRPTGKTYFDEIRTALDSEGSRLKVRILTLDPESDFAAKRGKQLGFAAAVFRDALRKALADTKKIAANYATDRFELRAYEDFPNQITFRIDECIFNCVVAQPTQSRNHLTFKLNRQEMGVDNSFITHFQNVWGQASRV
jgi:nucleoside 2-deoxyribosyltransferase